MTEEKQMATQPETLKPGPPKELIEMMIMQLETAFNTAFTVTPAPEYVKEASKGLLDSLKRWAEEGK